MIALANYAFLIQQETIMGLNSIFSDNMILAAEKPIRIFGCGCKHVSAEIDGMHAEGLFSGDDFLLEMPEHCYGGPYTLLVVTDGEAHEFRNIYFGDIILIAGQSNAQLKLRQTSTPKSEYESNDMLRLFTLERLETGATGEFFFPCDGWVKADADSVGLWSALAYLVGKRHQKATGHAVGVIACYQGASMIQSWIPSGILDATKLECATEKNSLEFRNAAFLKYNHDGLLYDFMFSKLIPYSMSAVVWYQGEENTHFPDGDAQIYGGMLKVLIERWREDLRDKALPFAVVQIADYIYAKEGWQEVQKAQEKISEHVERAFCVKCADICEKDDIHPKTKLPLAERISECILKMI